MKDQTRDVEKYVDKWGILDKLFSPDGGDSCQREGMFFALIGMLDFKRRLKWPRSLKMDYDRVMILLHVDDGVFVRHPNTDWDASDWDRMSRDQFQPMIIAAGYWDKWQLKKITIGHLKRGFLFTNNTRKNGANKSNHCLPVAGEVRDYGWKIPDPTLFDIWGNFIRAWNKWWLWPLLFITDLELFFGSIRWKFWPPHNIAMNHTLSLFQANDRMPTIWSWLATKIMKPVDLIMLIDEHLTDFDNPSTPQQEDMRFFTTLFYDAWESICANK